MNGGHFNNQENYMGHIAEQLEHDIGFNDAEYDSAKPIDTSYGFQHQPETIEYSIIIAEERNKLKDQLNEYDYAVSGDSSIEWFIENAREI